jgi:hypothetical protein
MPRHLIDTVDHVGRSEGFEAVGALHERTHRASIRSPRRGIDAACRKARLANGFPAGV